MKFKKWMIIPVALLIGLVIILFSINSKKEEEKNLPKPVKTITVYEKNENIEFEYSGTIQPETLKKIGFKMPGILKSIKVSDGQEIKKGDLIATLDTQELQMAIDASRNNLNTAESSYKFIGENYEKMIKLHEAGGVSAQELERYKLEKENAESLFNNAKIDYKNKQLGLNDSVLKADMNGYIIDILYEEGELVPVGYPVVVMRSNGIEVNFGLSQEDLSFVKNGDSVRIEENDIKYQGVIKTINKAPDPVVRTFETKIGFIDGTPSLSVGSIVKVFIQGSEEKGIWIPMNIILNDGADYVYVIDKENIAQKRIVKIEVIKNTMVKVSGLITEDVLVSEGFRNLRVGDMVSIEN